MATMLPAEFWKCADESRRAIDALAPFPAGHAKGALSEAVEFAIQRAY